MIRVRRVEDVAIVDWTHKDVAALVPRIRVLVQSREAPHALLNMSEVETLKGEGLETLTEALSVCEDGGCISGMYAVNTYVSKLLEIMDLSNVMPAALGATEAEALTRVRSVKPARGRNGGAPGAAPSAEVEIEFEPQEAPARAPAPRTPAAPTEDVVVEFDMDAPAAKPRPQAAGRPALPPLALTLKFDKSAVGAVHDDPEDILAISWADLASQGIPIGGPGGQEIVARATADAGIEREAALEADRVAATRPTTRFNVPPVPSAPNGELEIEIEAPLPAVAKPRAFKTEVIRTFDVNAEARDTAELKSEPVETGFRGDETRTDYTLQQPAPDLEVDFEPVRTEEVGFGPDTIDGLNVSQLPQSALFGESEPDASGWSPLDTDSEVRRPAALGAPPPTAPPAERTQTPPRPLPSRPAPLPVPVPSPVPPRAQPPAPSPTRPGQPPRPAPLPASPPPPHPAHAVPAPAPAPVPVYAGDGGDETIMFMPDGFLAEVLAAVSPTAAAPDPAAPARPSDTSLEIETRAPAPTSPAPTAPAPAHAHAPPAHAHAPAPAPAPQAAPVTGGDTREELRRFLTDYAVVSELHLRVLERFSREGIEKVIGRPEVQTSVGGSAAGVASIIEDFVQARLLKRRRSPRVRGGTGYLYSPSPKTRNAVTRLLRLYEDGTTRAEVLGWVQAARQAAGA